MFDFVIIGWNLFLSLLYCRIRVAFALGATLMMLKSSLLLLL